MLIETVMTGAPLDPERVVADPARAVRAGERFIARLPLTRPAAENAGWNERTIGSPMCRLAGLLPKDDGLALLVERTHALLKPLAEADLPATFAYRLEGDGERRQGADSLRAALTGNRVFGCGATWSIPAGLSGTTRPCRSRSAPQDEPYELVVQGGEDHSE
ncbi:hypothetical protein E2F48_15025 [Arthrobacter crusticola]|uniref:Uncharacterized protein n=1 Tax=Arthrobacter crusticola TaxID=2547960 RepID=A0A4R5TPL8_9MICC|nr:hypothetical protein [Arthrobacter crusticola]TDK24088.1 hypothetical protein E2F48_15025 [Arthrobacter crusticola]